MGICMYKKVLAAPSWAIIVADNSLNGPKIVTASKVDEMTIDVKGGGKMPENIALEHWRGTCRQNMKKKS